MQTPNLISGWAFVPGTLRAGEFVVTAIDMIKVL